MKSFINVNYNLTTINYSKNIQINFTIFKLMVLNF